MIVLIFHAVVSILAVMNPIGILPTFIALTTDYTEEERRHVARRSIVNAFIILIVFLLLGNLILQLFSITIDAFRVAGGILLFGIAYDLLHAQPSTIQSPRADEESALETKPVVGVSLGTAVDSGLTPNPSPGAASPTFAASGAPSTVASPVFASSDASPAVVTPTFASSGAPSIVAPSPAAASLTSPHPDIAMTPLAIPVIAGPGTITTVMALAAGSDAPMRDLFVFVAFTVVLAVTYCIFVYSSAIQRRMRQSQINVITRLMGFLLSIIAIQMAASGILGLFPGLGRLG